MAVINSPLRYPGGKSALSLFLAKVLAQNKLLGGIYAEPFAGGAGAAINLLLENKVNHIVINDADIQIYCFWKSILDHTCRFIERINDTDISIEEWHNHKRILEYSTEHNEFDVGFATFFLNRCNRSGILKAGPIGGKEQAGTWKINARFNKDNLIKRIKKIATRRQDITLHNLDALDFLSGPIMDIKGKKFVYIDPPYYQKGSQLYLNYYKAEDHEKLAMFIAKQDSYHWLMSYDNVDEIKLLYSNLNVVHFNLNYFAYKAKKSSELLISSHTLKLPDNDVEVNYGILPLKSIK